ncbi:uncharacterized protein THITE_2121715 [Thermothielavioides terrestris NRRL 8126]|uniref:DH domain-containing protein n=1 Tax=Thermothielavioides terrestris (strain ATCC 38088 / NRRL 8126) TaxID=578455 RepID=G2RF84_THETT|nr:uncharacterized protein THITE_2121715 [Thermothielavioides terrestris NRRL 8126]AEO70367.1 hypothetical protein THITE_2121715 [Thermothielavioides terrestris NRRL 8126]
MILWEFVLTGIQVYVTILAFLPSSPASLRSSVNRNLADIVELHEEILRELHRIVPRSEYTQAVLPAQRSRSNPPRGGHHRWRSLDAVPEGRDRVSSMPGVSRMAIEPQGAAEVAKIFLKRVNRFFIYEEYGAKYELMIKDVAAAHRMMPGWPSYQKGLEILASSLASADNSRDEGRKSLTIGDLLVKPIQRVCKYPLLFSELLKHTPVIDCPHAHMDIETTLVRLREATAEINRATNDSRTKSVLEKTWILQDRLAFPYQLDAASKNRIRSFGHIRLCGALHVCWQTKEGVDGQYMIALLYREWLCLATAGRVGQIYTIRACIAVANISLEDVDNGRGLQCHTAPHSWKIVFLCDHQLYELVLTACSAKEELEWCTRLRTGQQAADPDGQEQMQSDIFSFLSLNIKSLGTVFRKPGTIARRMSIHRATTLGPKSPLCQVILKNTSAVKDPPAPGYGSRINRSQSLLTTNSRIPVLAPSRDERARLEALLSDVWTRDVLPFPGITARSRSDHLVRTSASSMMRKFSGSITNGFNRRSASLASLQLKEKVGLGLDGEATSPSERRRTASIGTLYPQHAQERSAPLADPAERRASSPPRPRRAPVTLESDRSRTVRRRDTYASCITLDGRAVDGKGDDGDDGDGGKGGDCDDDASPLRSPSASIMLRKSSGNSPSRASFQRSARSEMAPSSVLDERCRPLGEPRGRNQARPSHSHKLSDRLAKARAKHREVVVQGIRSWFR